MLLACVQTRKHAQQEYMYILSFFDSSFLYDERDKNLKLILR